jgi:DNA polymerase (family X)
VAALRNRCIQVLGHPRGRIYNYRASLTANCPASSELQLNWTKPSKSMHSRTGRVLLAKKAGCRISFGTDSHGPSQLRFIEFAAGSALRAGVRPERILNFMSREQLLAWVRGVREQSFKFERKE